MPAIIVVGLVSSEIPDYSQPQRTILGPTRAAKSPQQSVFAKITYIAYVTVQHTNHPSCC